MTIDPRHIVASPGAASSAGQHSEDELVLALDQGGHSSRAIVFDASGRALARSSRAVAETRIGEDRVEQDAEEIVRSLEQAAGETLRALGSRARDVRCAGLATQRSSLVCWDRSTGTALSPVISWQDRRASAWLERFTSEADDIHRRTGLFLSPHYGASKMAWCLDHLPEVARARERGTPAIGPLASFLAFRLLREGRSTLDAIANRGEGLPRPRPFVVDPANASRTLLLSIATRGWDPRLCALFSIPVELLPRSVPTRFEFGSLAIGAHEIPLRVLTGDQSAAIFAGGEPRSDTAYVNLGTGAFVQRPFTGELVLLPRLLTSIVSSGRIDGASTSNSADSATTIGGDALFVIEGTINGAGSALRWVADELGLANIDRELDTWFSEAANPPLFLNGVSGLAAPYWKPRFASRFVGGGTPKARAVAVAESILFLVKIILDEMSPALPPPRRLLVSGGLARSDALCARLANVTQFTVERTLDPEATARGLAYQVLDRPAHWISDEARTFEPRADASLSDRSARFRFELERALALEP